MPGVTGEVRLPCRFEKIEEAKRVMRKKQELEQRFRVDGEGSGSDSDLEDEDKITEQEEAGARLAQALC